MTSRAAGRSQPDCVALGRGVTVTRVALLRGQSRGVLGKGFLGQLGFGWERPPEPWRRRHGAISLGDGSFKSQQGFGAINSCLHSMAVVWPGCAVNIHPSGFPVPGADSQCWCLEQILLLCSRSSRDLDVWLAGGGSGAVWVRLTFPCPCSVHTQLRAGKEDLGSLGWRTTLEPWQNHGRN